MSDCRTPACPDKRSLTAPCGLDCFNCTYHRLNITEQITRAIAERTGLSLEDIPCKGCIDQGGHCPWFKSCDTYDCVTRKEFRFCFECPDFPCQRLQPAADGAERFPHNMKVYNLCRMKAVGVERWAEEESRDIRARYFGGRFVVGRGPQLLEKP